MTILETGNYRIHTITQITNDGGFFDKPISYGLAIEKKCSDKSYYVICFIKFNEKKLTSYIESLDGTIYDIATNEWELFKTLCKLAQLLVETANWKIDDVVEEVHYENGIPQGE